MLSMDLRIILGLVLIFFIHNCEGRTLYQNNRRLAAIPNVTSSSITGILLFSNRITSIPSYALRGATSALRVDLQKNLISTTSEDAFKGTPILILSLGFNPLAHFPYFPHIDNTLRTLNLIRCKITNTNWDLVVPYTHLKDLTLNSNAIKHMPDLNRTKSTLVLLSLRNCKISELKPHYFRGFNLLRQLDIGMNDFTELKAHTFDGLDSLVYLQMARNKVVATDWFTFAGLSKLERFYANEGHLTTFPCVGPFSPFLILFYAHNNKIENFPANCTKFANVTMMTFSDNNLQGATISGASITFTNINSFNFADVGKVCFEFDGLNQLKQATAP